MNHSATHCNTLQHTATHCNTLQHTTTHRSYKNKREIFAAWIDALKIVHVHWDMVIWMLHLYLYVCGNVFKCKCVTYTLNPITCVYTLFAYTLYWITYVCTCEKTVQVHRDVVIWKLHLYLQVCVTVLLMYLYVSFAKEPFKTDNILKKRPIIPLILLTVATPYLCIAWVVWKLYLYLYVFVNI